MYQCYKKLVTYKEYSCFDHSDFPLPANSMFTFEVCWGSLGTSIFENSSSSTIILDPDCLPDYPSVSYDYEFSLYFMFAFYIIISFNFFNFFFVITFTEHQFYFFWLDFELYHRALHVFKTFDLVSFLAKFIAGSLELGRDRTMVCSKTMWYLHGEDIYRTWADFWDGAFCKNSQRLKAVDYICRNLCLGC